MGRLIGTAISAACRLALRFGLGLRVPAAKIRQHDLCKNREFAAGKVRDAMDASAASSGGSSALASTPRGTTTTPPSRSSTAWCRI